jgi:transposase InsO family protein
VIFRRGPWKSREAVELATLTLVNWFNKRQLLEPLGYAPPAEFESAYYDKQANPAMVVGFN